MKHYKIGEDIPFGEIPEYMLAYVLRDDRLGSPINAFQEEIIPVPEVGPYDVLIKVKAAGVNHNGIWSALGEPFSSTRIHKKDFHIAGSDASGVVWKIGEAIDKQSLHFREGDEVVVHCGQYCGDCAQCDSGDPMLCMEQKIWGYETPYGSFAQFSIVKPYQILPKPGHLTWAQAAGYMLVLATVWRMLFGYAPHTLKPAQNLLVWGGAGGLGVMAIQLAKAIGANPIAVVSSDERGRFCLDLGAKAYVNRTDFNCWGEPPAIDSKEYPDYIAEVRRFGRELWKTWGHGVNADIVLEHVGELTFPVSCYLANKGGMIVYCGATSGFNLCFDAAHGWMRQKRIQGSHFASTADAHKANQEVMNQRIEPVVGQVFNWSELPMAHQLMYENKNPNGNMVISLEY